MNPLRFPRTLDEAFRKTADYGNPIETPSGRKVSVRVGNVTYLRNDWFARIVRAIKRIIK
jgi:hypothetical protein